jgi:hypothetical protein
MDEGPLGKIFGHNTARLIVFILGLFIFSTASAEQREYDLFVAAYEHYLAYKPERAVEEFSVFLREFPESSAADAALFWLGSSLMQLKRTGEAKDAFLEIKERFPDSPLIPHADKKIGELERGQGEIHQPAPPLSSKTDTAGKVEKEEGLQKQMEEKERVERAMKQLAGRLDEAEKEKRSLEEKLTAADEANARASREKEEAASLIDELKKQKELLERELDALNSRREEPDSAPIPGYVPGATEFILLSTSLADKTAFDDAIWRRGDAFEDWSIETALCEEAMRAGIVPDRLLQKEISERCGLGREEEEYLGYYLSIRDLVDEKLAEMGDVRMLESLTVHYGETDKYRKITIAPELQLKAQSAMTFTEIVRLYPEITGLGLSEIGGAESGLSEPIRSLEDGQTGVVWSEGGYTIYRAFSRQLSCGVVKDVSPETRKRVMNGLYEWIEGLRLSEIRAEEEQ